MQTAKLAEQLPGQFTETRSPLYVVPDEMEMPRVCSVEEMEFEAEVQANYRAWIGSVALSRAGEAQAVKETSDVNILERIKAAKAGDPEAEKWLDINAGTAVCEAVFKEGYVDDIFMDPAPEGGLVQFGQSNASIHENAIIFRPGRHEILQDVTQAEALNRHRIEAAFEAGKLKDHYYVVVSLVPNGVPEKQLGHHGDGYFLDSLSLNIQATTETPNGRAKTEVAFMSGVEEQEDDNFAERMARRHDFKAASKVYEWFGKKAPDSAAGIIRSGLYIPKDMMPNGVTDFMYWLDCAKDEVQGRKVERRPEDYAALRLDSKRRKAGLDGVRGQVVKGLKDMGGSLQTAAQASKYMWELVREYATEASFTNRDIDPKVFGRKAAPEIEEVRRHAASGNERLAQEHMRKAHEESEVTGCGGGASGSMNEKEEGSGIQANEDMESYAGSDRYGARAFRCPNGHLNIRPRDEKIPECQHDGCSAKVAC